MIPVIHDPALRLEREGREARIDLAIRIDDVREQLGPRMRAHAAEIGREVGPFLVEFVADGAGRGEERFALHGVAVLLDHREERGDQLVLLLGDRAAELVDRLSEARRATSGSA